MKKAIKWILNLFKQVCFTAVYIVVFMVVLIIVAFEEAYTQAWESFIKNIKF